MREMKKLGFGGMRFPQQDPEKPESIDQEQVNRMVDAFLEKGFCYFDTAYVYHQGLSEGAFRQALARYDRDRYLIADKMPTFSVTGPEQYAPIFQEQLERCGVEYFDYYLLHNLNRHTYENTEKFGGFDFAARMKEEGKVRHWGFSFHDTPELLEKILTRHPEVEFVQLQLNYVDWDSPIVEAGRCYEVAKKHGKPVIVMEPVKGGGLAKDLPEDCKALLTEYHPEKSCASWALRFAASLENVMMVLSGMSSLEQMEDNLRTMDDPEPLNEEEKKIINQVRARINEAIKIPCTHCNYCTDTCPQKVDIPGYFAIYNGLQQFKTLDHHTFQYNRQIVGHGKASDCIACGQCEAHCPQHIEIIERLKDVAETFEH